MHQSPQKDFGRRHGKQFEFELTEAGPERLRYRESQPKARKFHLHDDSPRAQRWDKEASGR
jgi:hypothetical protein